MSSYQDQVNAINSRYQTTINEINTRYNNLRATIQAKEITAEYTAEDKEAELAENEENRSNELENVESQKNYEIGQLNITYINQHQANEEIDFNALNSIIENIDFDTPEEITISQEQLQNMEDAMENLPTTIENTRYIYLTVGSKGKALQQLALSEYNTYSAAYDEIATRYNNLASQINATYDGYKTTIEAKEITEQYTAEDKAQELATNEANRTQALAANETSKTTETEPLNTNYAEAVGEILTAIGALGEEKETGFMGNVHINGKLHVNTDIFLEGKLNNIPIENLLTQSNLTPLITVINTKADVSHTHTLSDITNYTAFDNTNNETRLTALENSITTKAEINHNHDSSYASINHTHTSFNNLQITNGDINFNQSDATASSIINFNNNGDHARIRFANRNGTRENGLLEIATSDDANEPIVVRQYKWANSNSWDDYRREAYLLDASGNTSFPGNLTCSNITSPTITNLQNLITSKADDSMITALAARVSIVETDKADISHTHSEYAPINHNHDSSYASVNHNHDLDYAALSHSHNEYSLTNHNHDSVYASVNHNHNSLYSSINHNHDSVYAPISHNHTLSNITDYEPFDNSTNEARLTALENNKIDKSQILISPWKYRIVSITLSNDFQGFHGIANITNQNNILKFITLQSFPGTPTFYIYTGGGATPERIDITPTIEEVPSEILENWQDEEDLPQQQYTIDYSWYFLPDPRQWKYMMTYGGGAITYETEIADITLSKNSRTSATTSENLLSSDAVRELMNEYMERVYPVGSIYTSMTDLNPAYVFGFGTWTQITNRFLYCSDSNAGTTGGSKKILTTNLPAHKHHIDSYTNTDGSHKHTLHSEYDDFNGNMGSGFKDATMANAKFSLPNDTGTTGAIYTRDSYTNTDGSHRHRIQIDTQNTGDGTDYMPPFINVYCWYRTE